MAQMIDRERLRRQWEDSLAEDGVDRDITSLTTVDDAARGTARLVARQGGVFAGAVIFDLLREAYSHKLTVTVNVQDGADMRMGDEIAVLAGPMQLLLGIERTLLNFLQRLCGVATLTRKYVDAVEGTQARIYDTRKTIPGWRQLDKYAVRCGGGRNHRMGLHDAILVKDNHLAGVSMDSLAVALFDMVREAAALTPPPAFIEVEVDTIEQLEEVFKVSGVDVILLDNFTLDQMRQAVKRRDELGLAGRVQFEASGGVDLSSVRGIAETGVERIAIGAVTHSAVALDVAMDLETIRLSG
ncbi:MAG: carboxylating nicotinate-nucleotide diphosphorylase [Phycisphaerae bacterium]|nr:carboxylating nicotinate-nucleotide diphosphorylase [Phycisphaerae bacterium]